MSQTDNNDYSTQRISPHLISQIIDAIKNKAWGSVEIYVENFTVTQITERTITKVAKPNRQKETTPPKNGPEITRGSSSRSLLREETSSVHDEVDPRLNSLRGSTSR